MARYDEYGRMPHRFDVAGLLLDAARLRGKFYPGMLLGGNAARYPAAPSFEGMPDAPALRTETAGGVPIRKQDALGRWYFMPVWIRSSLGEVEMPCAVISVTGKKRIVETPLIGRRGAVNELIGVDSYEVELACALIGQGGNYPETEVKRMRDLYELNEAVELVSALTDLVFETDDKIVIESIDLPAMGGAEDVQVVKMKAHTDAAVELVIE